MSFVGRHQSKVHWLSSLSLEYNRAAYRNIFRSMARILSISPLEVLRTTRQLILEQEGYQVLSLADLSQGHTFSKDDKFDLAIVGHNLRGQNKRKIAEVINKQFPGLPILELCFHSPEIPGADFIFSDSPDEILGAIREILAGHRVRGFLP